MSAITRFVKKPSIPALTGWPEPLLPVARPVRETLEIITGRRGQRISPLSGSVPLDNVAEKINEIIRVLQDGSDVEVNVLGGTASPPPPATQVTVNNITQTVVQQFNNGFTYGADNTGATSAVSAIQNAINNTSNRVITLAPGDYLIDSSLILKDSLTFRGAGRDATRLIKTNFNGAAILGIDVDNVAVEEMSIVGPGRTEGWGNSPQRFNKGIEIRVSTQEICKSPVLRNLVISDVNDVGVYLGTCSYVTWQSVRVFNYGYCGIWIDGGDGHNLDACSTQYGLIGFYINRPGGYGPTTVTMQACYAEQAGRGVWFNGAVSCTASGCGVEAAINWDATHNGINWTITGGENVALIGCLSRNDTVGNAIAAPHVLVDGTAQQVLIDGFRKQNHATFALPTWELDCQNAGTVRLGRHNFDTGRIRSNSKISTVDVTVLP